MVNIGYFTKGYICLQVKKGSYRWIPVAVPIPGNYNSGGRFAANMAVPPPPAPHHHEPRYGPIIDDYGYPY